VGSVVLEYRAGKPCQQDNVDKGCSVGSVV